MTVNWLAIGAVSQLFLFALISIISRAPVPSSGMRASDRNLLFSTIVFLGLWFAGFDARSLMRSFGSTPRAEASVLSHRSSGSCASIARDMSEAQVQKRLGEPYEKRSDEEVRGPGTTIWIYRDSRCAVHLFDNHVEFVE